MTSFLAYFRNLCRALLGADSAILAELSTIRQEITAMSANSDRFQTSLDTLNATIDNIVIPAITGANAVSGDTDALFASGADALDAANSKILAAHTAAAPAPVVTDQPAAA